MPGVAGEQVPTEEPDGLPGPLPGVYDDQGEAPEDGGVRALIGFANRDRAGLEQKVANMYDPTHLEFQQYIGVQQWMTEHAPYQDDYDLIKAWLASRGMAVTYEASNRLLIAFKGSVKDFNATFKTTLHICMRKNPQIGNPPFAVYCTLDTFTLAGESQRLRHQFARLRIGVQARDAVEAQDAATNVMRRVAIVLRVVHAHLVRAGLNDAVSGHHAPVAPVQFVAARADERLLELAIKM